MTVTVDSADFHRLLKTGLICAANDSTMPMITAVKLESTAGQLLSVSTDRFRIGVTKIPAHGFLQAEALIPADQVKHLVSVLKPAPRAPEMKVILDVVPIDDQVFGSKLMWSRSDGLSGTIELVQQGHPKWRHLMAGYNQGMMDPSQADFDAHRFIADTKYLCDFAKAAWRRDDYMTVEAVNGKTRPVIVRVGTHFLGLLMPVRTAPVNDTETRIAWIDAVRGEAS